MNSPLMAELARENWAMEQGAFLAFMQKAEMATSFLAASTTTAQRGRSTKIADGVASIPIAGVLMKKVPAWVRFFGIEATGYDEIAADIEAALANKDVTSIHLAVQSPGGQVSGVREVSDAIFKARSKGVTAHIEDIGASAAYWLASQAHRVTASPNSVVGSIGTLTTYVDSAKLAENVGLKVHVIASGPHKSTGAFGVPITAEQLKPIQGMIDQMAAEFLATVARGRGLDAADEASKERMAKWASARVWLADESVELGLIDEVVSIGEKTSPGGPAAALAEEEKMANETEKAAAEEKIRSEAAGVERKRLADLKAAFPGEEKFVMEQFEAGANVLQAEAAFSKVLRTRLAAKETELEAAKKAKPAPQAREGAEALAAGGDPGEAVATLDFLPEAERMVRDGEAKDRTEAMLKLAKGKRGQRNSAVLEKHLQGCLAAAPAHAALKAAAGVS